MNNNNYISFFAVLTIGSKRYGNRFG